MLLIALARDPKPVKNQPIKFAGTSAKNVIGTDLIKSLLRNRMESASMPSIRLHRRFLVHCKRSSQDWSADFHAALDDSSAIVTYDPLDSFCNKVFCSIRRRFEESKRVEAVADLDVGCIGNVVESAKMGDVRGWKGGVRLQTFEEDA